MSNTPKRPPTSATAPTGGSSGYTETLQAPVVGDVTSGFGKRKAVRTSNGNMSSSNHQGIDIGAPNGTAVHAAASGTIEFAGVQGGYGNRVVIRHNDNTETSYSHLSKIAVRKGSSVKQGWIIGYVGSTGNSTGNHLHYEVIENGVKVNPAAKTIGIKSYDRTADEKKKSDGAEAEGKAYDPTLSNRLRTLQYSQEEVIRKLLTGEHFEGNPCNDFLNLTYHWRLFITTDQEILVDDTTTVDGTVQSFYEELAKYKQVTIAESGVTTFSIDSVTIKSAVGTDYLAGSALFNNLEMRITEPNGVLFLDALRAAAIEAGVQNYQKTFYYLELTFKGYDENGDVNLAPFADLPNGGKWIWSVVINNIDVNLAAGGGTYVLSMAPMNDSLMTSRLNLVPCYAEARGETVGEFMESLCAALNTYWTVIKGEPGIVTYKVKFHPVEGLMTAEEVKAMRLDTSNTEFNEERSIAFDSNRTGHIPKGFTISEVLDSIMQSCEQAQNLAKDGTFSAEYIDASTSQSNSTTGYRQSVIWRIEPELHHPDYDPIMNEYYKEITIHVYGYRHHTAVLSPIDTMSDEETQRAIIADLAARNFLPKKYEYLFTGVNTEVLDIDLSFKLSWAALLPRVAFANQEQVETQAKARPEDMLNRPAGIDRSKEKKTDGELATDHSRAALDIIDIDNQRELLFRQRNSNPPEITQEEFDSKMAELRQLEQEKHAKVLETARPLQERRREIKSQYPKTKPSTVYEREYGEELTRRRSDYNEREEKAVFPVTIDVYDPDNITGTSGQYHPGKSMYGAVLNQVFGPVTDKLNRIEMTVRGDPFWIGPGSFEQAVVRKSETFTNKWPNFSQGGNTILFRMAYPLGQDDDGNVILNTDETATGIYQVNRITHRFENGQFTQVLECTRSALIDIYKSLYRNMYETEQAIKVEGNEGE